jgi:hypothetical protein
VVVQGLDVVSVRCADRVVEIIGGGKVAEHSGDWRHARQVIRARLRVLTRVNGLGCPGVQLFGVDEHR